MCSLNTYIPRFQIRPKTGHSLETLEAGIGDVKRMWLYVCRCVCVSTLGTVVSHSWLPNPLEKPPSQQLGRSNHPPFWTSPLISRIDYSAATCWAGLVAKWWINSSERGDYYTPPYSPLARRLFKFVECYLMAQSEARVTQIWYLLKVLQLVTIWTAN